MNSIPKWISYSVYIAAGLAMQICSLQATDQTVDGDLTVTGVAGIKGDTVSLGTWPGTPSQPGWSLGYGDGTLSSVEFDAGRAANIWRWQENGGVSLKLQMKLDESNVLTLYNQASPQVATITLDPAGTSTFSNQFVSNGIDTEMPNQTIVGPNSVLTEGLASTLYYNFEDILNVNFATPGFCDETLCTNATLSERGYRTAEESDQLYWNNLGTSGGITALSLGYQTTAASYRSVALGYGSVAGDNGYCLAMGYNTTVLSGNGVAMGYNSSVWADCIALGSSTSNGWSSVAMGNSYVEGGNAVAMGESSAIGDNTVSMGVGTTAQSYSSFAFGRYNVGAGGYTEATQWIDTNTVLEIGNGADDEHRSNILSIYKNGDAKLQGALKAAPGGDVAMFSGN